MFIIPIFFTYSTEEPQGRLENSQSVQSNGFVVPVNHPFNWIFHCKPSILGYPHDYANPQIWICSSTKLSTEGGSLGMLLVELACTSLALCLYRKTRIPCRCVKICQNLQIYDSKNSPLVICYIANQKITMFNR